MISRLTSLGLARHSTLSRVLALTALLVVFSLASFGQTVTATLPTPFASFVVAVNPETNKTYAVDGAEMVVIDGGTHPASPERFVSTASPKVPRSPARGPVPPSALPPSALPMISAALGTHDPGYGIRAHGRALRAGNPRQGLAAEFSSNGVVVTSRDASLRMKFAGYGSGKDIAPARAVRPIARDNRIEYRRGPLTEWYVNGPAGLEQGFTLKAPPKRQGVRPFQIVLDYSGDLQPELDKNGKALVLKRRDGSTALRYTGLEAHDAGGHSLHASMELRGKSLRLLVDDHDARYPVVVDPLFQAAILTPSNGTKIDGFGSRVAVSGDGNTIVVGAPNSQNREAYVFEKQGAAWTSMTEVRRLSDPDGGIGVLAITDNGDTILSNAVAALHEDVFVRPGTSWSGSTDKTPDATLTQTQSSGRAAAISGDGSTVVVGPSAVNGDQQQLFVFLRPGDDWSGTVNPAATLTGSQQPNLFDFGQFSIAIDFHANVIVGNANISPDGEDVVGELLVFLKEPEGGWTSKTEDAILRPNISTTGDAFGRAIAISSDGGSTILAGDPFATVNSNREQGEAYVFVQPADAAWTSTNTPDATLFDASGAAGDVFGSALAMSGDAHHILVGVPTRISGPGRVSTFDIPDGGWTGTLSAPENLTASDSSTEFGFSVSISDGGGVAAIGTRPQNQIGEAYVFTTCVSLAPGDFDFGNVLMGTASPPETFTLSNSCAAAVTNIDISLLVGGGFSQNNTCGSTLLGNTSCDINVTFTPSSVGLFSDTVLVNDSDTSSSPQSAELTGTGVCGVSLAPGSFAFGNINVGSSSPPTAFTLSNQCTTDVTGVAISFSGTNSADFSQNNTCGGAIPAGGSCTINVTFAPTTGGAESAKLVVDENDPSSPQQATLTGTGVALSGDFSITPTDAEPPTTPGSTTSATVSAGSSATYAFSVKSLAGFNSTVALSAVFTGSNQPTGTNLSFDVNPVTPTTSGVTSTLTVSTSAPHAFMMRTGTQTRYAVWLVTFPLMLFGMAWLPVSVETRRRAVKSALLLCAVCAILFASSCVPKAPATPGTAAGTYQILVTATGGGITHTTNVTLVVQ